MRTLKRIAACVVAATAAVTSVAVTASADYQVSISKSDSGGYSMGIGGVPQAVFDYDTISMVMFFGDHDSNDIGIRLDIYQSKHSQRCVILDSDLNVCGNDIAVFTPELDGERVFSFVFSEENDKEVAEFIERAKGGIFLFGTSEGSNGEQEKVFFNSSGGIVDKDYYELFTIAGASNVSTSEPTNSEPVSEPENDPTTEPAATEPVTEPESSQAPSTTQNPNSGFNGIGFVYAAAVAAGVAVVARKKK